MKVRAYVSRDAASLTAVHQQSPFRFNQDVQRLRAVNGRIWVVADVRNTAVGYAAMLPVPGLVDLLELEGGIVPEKRRMGYGRLLLRHVLEQAKSTPYRQLSVRVPNPDDQETHFLQAHGFFLEHEEWVLRKEPLLPDKETLAPEVRVLAIADEATAVASFIALYEQSFAPHPWYQPYIPAELTANLSHPHDLLFLYTAQTAYQSAIPNPQSAIGFAWLHLQGTMGEIEPMGITPMWQGKGYGRILLRATLQHLAQRGASSAQITAWHNNHRAIHLYQNIGFQHVHTHTYLAYNLHKA